MTQDNTVRFMMRPLLPLIQSQIWISPPSSHQSTPHFPDDGRAGKQEPEGQVFLCMCDAAACLGPPLTMGMTDAAWPWKIMLIHQTSSQVLILFPPQTCNPSHAPHGTARTTQGGFSRSLIPSCPLLLVERHKTSFISTYPHSSFHMAFWHAELRKGSDRDPWTPCSF